MIRILLAHLLFFIPLWSQAELCPNWSGEDIPLSLPSPPFSEVSGIAASRQYPGRLYIANDSGDDGSFYVYELETGEYKKVFIDGFPGFDIEALSLGPCGGDTCIYIGDIGDNQLRRKIVRIAAIKERNVFPNRVSPHIHKIMQYPDRAHDAEGMVMSSDGELFVFSKEFGYFASEPTSIFKTTYRELTRGGYGKFESLGRMSLNGWLGSPLLTVTDATLSPDESSLFFLTYTQGYEVRFEDLKSQAKDSSSMTYLDSSSFGLYWGRQSEAATYLYPDESLLWTYEDRQADVPIVIRDCLR